MTLRRKSEISNLYTCEQFAYLKAPCILQEAIVYFSDPERCFQYACKIRWPDGYITCPRCNSDRHYPIKSMTKKGEVRRLWLCRGCNKQFSVKVGTIFEGSALGLDKWMTAFWMLYNSKNGVSSMEIQRTVGITQRSALFMLGRLRMTTQDDFFGKRRGSHPTPRFGADETFTCDQLKGKTTRRAMKRKGLEK